MLGRLMVVYSAVVGGLRVRSPLIFHDKVDDLLWILSFLQGFTIRWKQGIWSS